MLQVAEAQERILAGLVPTPVEWVALPQAAGRVLAGDLHAKRDQPPVAVSAMDGYAVRAADTVEPGRQFRLVGEAAAGGQGTAGLAPGETVRIFTGGAVPPGADAIVIQENATAEGDEVRFSAAVSAGTFVRPAGLDFARGWAGLPAGTLLDARGVGLAASLGHLWLPVRRRPRIGLLATGNELRWPGETPEGSQIASSNTVTAGRDARRLGSRGRSISASARTRERPWPSGTRGALGLDMLVTTGGASVGDYDLVQRVLGREGMTLDFWKIAMRPGKPLLHGRLGCGPGPGLPRQSGLYSRLRPGVSPRGPAEDAGASRGPAVARGGNRQRPATQRPAPGLSPGEPCRGLGRAQGDHGGSAGQLDAGNVRTIGRAGGPATLRCRPADRRRYARD